MEKTKKVISFLKRNWLFFLIVLILAFLRTFNLYQTTMFLSDQGRDAIIIRDIVTFKHFPAIGAPTSIGQVYLGPFYYYLISPFLLIFNFNPVGLSYGVAILSILSLIWIFFLIKKEINEIVAWFFLIGAGFSKIIIDQSRYSWNPNLLPYFAFLTLYFFNKLQKERKIIFAVLLGSFLSFSIQLHYLAVLILLPILLYGTYDFFNLNRKWRLTYFYHYLIAVFFFFFFSLPLLIFDLRHNFLNSKNFLKLFSEQNLVGYQSKTAL
ncbi:MAG: glycosyltransferase family 39 protein, partial [Microgenomates group bacterium]|nr:glycosyltransferase family 39 protein [Microgenomates group bacterium]